MYPTYSQQLHSNFSSTLRVRVNEYFKINQLNKQGGASIIWKAIVMMSIYFCPYIIIICGSIVNPWVFMSMWGVMGVGLAGIGMSITHDANHNSFSKNHFVNRVAGYSMNLVGATPFLWKIQHNHLHHSFTNVHGFDTDIETPFILRFSPNEPHRWYHRFQHLYIWLFYSVSTLSWMTIKEFIQIVKFYKRGYIKTRRSFIVELIKLIGWKVIYYSYMILIPMFVLPFNDIWVVAGFLFMHLVSGIIISLVFQTAHVMPEVNFIRTDSEMKINNNWMVHQMETTCNYAPNNRFFTWFAGGLNFQIEHHLFTNISHIHYRDISSIVIETAEEFGIKYHQHSSFLRAVWAHLGMLKKLGRVKKKT